MASIAAGLEAFGRKGLLDVSCPALLGQLQACFRESLQALADFLAAKKG